jgi:hypothetical protein
MAWPLLESFYNDCVKHLDRNIRDDANSYSQILTSQESTNSRGIGTMNPKASSRITGACCQCDPIPLGVACCDEMWL